MAHSRGFDLSRITDDAQDRFGRQFAGLARDMRHFSDSLSRYADNTRHDIGHVAHDFVDEAWEQGRVAAHALGKQARKAGRAVRRDPVPAAVALIGLACLVSLVATSTHRR